MKIIALDDVLSDRETREAVVSAIKGGDVFVYPTDTVYGIGCDATNSASVKRIREAKDTDHPFSVIAPSFSWIKENFVVRFPEYLQRFPGPVTLIMEQKRPVLPDIVSGSDRIGIRIPRHPFTDIIQQAGLPFITTSANISGEKTITEIKKLPLKIEKNTDIAIDGGTLGTMASTIIDLTGERPVVVRE